MKRLIATLVALFLVSSAAPAAAFAEQGAFAAFLRLRGAKGTAYLVDVYRYVDPLEGTVTEAIVAKLPCTVKKSKGWRSVDCFGPAELHELELEDFTVDPLLGSASVTIEGAGHHLEWEADEPSPSGGAAVIFGGWGAGAGAGLERMQTASGNLYGKRMQYRPRSDFAVAFEGAGAGMFLPTSAVGTLHVTFDLRDGPSPRAAGV